MRLERCNLRAAFVRLFHTALTLGITATIVFTPTSIKKAVLYHQDLLYACGYLTLLGTSLVLYWVTCLCDPGFVHIDVSQQLAESDEEGEVTLETSHMLCNGVALRRCGFCGIEQPLRARHCEDCGRCVRRYDHHCPWLDTCIGERNHRFFWLFLLFKSLLIVWTTMIVWQSFERGDSWQQWLRENVFYLLDMFVLVLAGFVVVCLCAVHSYLMVTGLTTWEALAHHHISYLKSLARNTNPFHEGYLRNTLFFLCRLGKRNWEKVYNARVNTASRGASEQVI